MFIKIASKTSAHTPSNLFLNFISSIQHSQLHKHTVDDCFLTSQAHFYTSLQGRGFEMYETDLILITLLEILYCMCAYLYMFMWARLWVVCRHMGFCVCMRKCEGPLIEDVKGGCPRSN